MLYLEIVADAGGLSSSVNKRAASGLQHAAYSSRYTSSCAPSPEAHSPL